MMIILDRQWVPRELAVGTQVNSYRIYNTYTSSSSGPCLTLHTANSLSAFTRAMLHAESVARQFLPPTPIAETE